MFLHPVTFLDFYVTQIIQKLYDYVATVLTTVLLEGDFVSD